MANMTDSQPQASISFYHLPKLFGNQNLNMHKLMANVLLLDGEMWPSGFTRLIQHCRKGQRGQSLLHTTEMRSCSTLVVFKRLICSWDRATHTLSWTWTCFYVLSTRTTGLSHPPSPFIHFFYAKVAGNPPVSVFVLWVCLFIFANKP